MQSLISPQKFTKYQSPSSKHVDGAFGGLIVGFGVGATGAGVVVVLGVLFTGAGTGLGVGGRTGAGVGAGTGLGVGAGTGGFVGAGPTGAGVFPLLLVDIRAGALGVGVRIARGAGADVGDCVVGPWIGGLVLIVNDGFSFVGVLVGDGTTDDVGASVAVSELSTASS